MAENTIQRIALVTGGAIGIGKRISEVLGAAGCRVAICDIDQASMDAAVQELTARNIAAMGVKADISRQDEIDRLLPEIADKWDAPDILVNNAGITRDALLMRLSESDWDAVLTVNLKAAFLLTKACIRPMLKKRWGRVVNIASVIGLMGNAGQANYAAAKAGLIGLTMSTAREVASRNVTVNAVAPGFIDTAMTKKLPEAVVEEYKKSIPLGRLGQPEDVARAVEFLTSDAAGYLTGQVIRVDGGMIMG
jgi:3-oxoacyl-[acyl-carrier protein] reductase